MIAESINPRRLPPALISLRDKGVPIVIHGLGLSLGGAERPDRRRLRHLAACAEALRSPLVSEHLAFVRAAGPNGRTFESGHLLPVPRTRAVLDIVVENVGEAQARLPVPLAIENIATLVQWPDDEMDEATFLSELVARTHVRLLVDVANLYANARNAAGGHPRTPGPGCHPTAVLNRLPLDAVAYVHVAGGTQQCGRYYDTHRHAVPPEVLALLTTLCRRHQPPGVLLEWDGDFLSDAARATELRAVSAAAARQQLAARQSALLAALLLHAPLPPGIDPSDAAAAAAVLRRRLDAARPDTVTPSR